MLSKGLHFHKPFIWAIFSCKFCVCTLLYDPAVFENEDDISLLNGRKAMRYYN